MKNESLMLDIESFMRYYVPKGWNGAIRQFDFIPYLTPDEAESISKGIIPNNEKFTGRWYILAALKDWMKKNNIKYIKNP